MGITFSFPFILITVLILALLSFFFSASETAIIGLSKIRLRNMLAKGVKHAKSIQVLVTKLDKFIAAILIGNNFVNIAISSIFTAVCVHLFGYRLGVVAATFISTFFVLIFCDITPKILAAKHSEKIALSSAPFMEAFIRIFHPIVMIFTAISNFILKLMRIAPGKRSPLITEEELRMMIEIGKEEGVLSDEERRMLQRIFEFGDTKVKDVMVTLDKVVSASIDSDPNALLDVFVEEGHARLPVYRDNPENIVGIIYARDLLYPLREKELFLLQDLMREVAFVPESMRVNQLLLKFQVEKIQVAIVLGENKKVVGLVTLEDLIEEIVGELEERHSPKKLRSGRKAAG
jgi:putative hemolysin